MCENHIQIIENTHFGGNLFGPLSNSQRYHFVADQATKPLLQRFAHLAPWEAESIQEIAEEFQYLWLHWMCRNDGMSVFQCANIHIYLGTQMTRLCWLDFVPCFGGWKRLQNKNTFTGSSFFSQDSLFHASLQPFIKARWKVQGGGFRDFWSFPHLKTGWKSQLLVPEYLLLEYPKAPNGARGLLRTGTSKHKPQTSLRPHETPWGTTIGISSKIPWSMNK